MFPGPWQAPRTRRQVPRRPANLSRQLLPLCLITLLITLAQGQAAPPVETLLRAGEASLDREDWSGAARNFEQALAAAP